MILEEQKCPFSAPLITHQFDCVHAKEVIHRGGTEIACNGGAVVQPRCDRLFQRLKAAALPAFGVEDDLLSMPHSVLVKIQYGGLLGLQRLLSDPAPAAERVENIDALLQQAQTKWGSMEAISCDSLVPDITAFKPRSRRGH